ncbi:MULTISPECIES: ATP-binding protein [unclassified Serratia (in: enterobacteria)]|uniref:ATP-binding protein n=1 Tax=unclassified Serratia (in: enterobacteria) TaxID=2647522 RepID=UPI00069133BB|nr:MULTISPECIES: ATP-binding protein [unclassified Serratia (in: enterobacteria)]
MLVFGFGFFSTFMLLLVFTIGVKTAVLNHIEMLHQDFTGEHAMLEREIVRLENTFSTMLVGAEILLKENIKLNNDYVRQFYLNDNQLFLKPASASTSQWVYNNKNLTVDKKVLRHFLSLSSYLGKVISADSLTMQKDILSSYLYSVGHEMVGIIPAPSLARREQFKSAPKYYLNLLTQDVDKTVFSSGWGEKAHGANRTYWMPPYINPYSGEKVLRLAAPLLRDNVPFAVLVIESSPSALMLTSMPEDKQGTYTLLSKQGDIINQRGERFFGQPAIQGKKHPTELQEEGVTFVATLGETGWFLVFHCPWRQIVSTVVRQVGDDALITFGSILLVWCLLIYFKFYLFRPFFRQSQQVLESEQLSLSLIETAPVGLGLLRLKNGEPLLRSPVMTQTQVRLQTRGNSLPAVLAECYRQQTKTSENGFLLQEFTFCTHDGLPVNLAVSMAPARYRGEDALVVAFIDITDKKQLEQHLIAAKESADKASAAKSYFLAAMSHEIRTPLNAILGNLELLAHSTLDEQRARLAIVRHASDRLLSTISDVLDLSKIEAGELHLEHIEFDALDVASRELEIFAPIARAKGLVLLGELGDTTSQLMLGDPDCLGQVLNNLLSNALKFTEQGKVMLRIRVDAPASLIYFEVEDTGIGMSTLQQQQIFQAFNQTDVTIRRRYGGTGLGLALCKRFTEAMHGELSVTSEPGEGSVFRLSLPLSQATGQVVHPFFHGERICVLAAEPESRAYLAKVLTAWGLEVESYQHPTQIDDMPLESLQTLVLWGDQTSWHPDDENRLIEHASWVIDCRSDGPVIPVVTGRILSTSMYGISGLALALGHSLQGHHLPLPVQDEQPLPRNLRVLVVEDNPFNRHLLEEQLRLLGCTVCLVEEGEQALARLQHEQFDVLLTDLSMPGMDGYSLARRVQAAYPKMPVVAVTADATPQEYIKCSSAGMVRVLIKPLLLKELKQLLLEVCNLETAFDEALLQAENQVSALLNQQALPEDMWDIFEYTCQSSFDAIRETKAIGDTAGLLKELHKLRGALSVYHFPEAEKELAEIESHLRFGRVEAMMQLEPFLHQLQHKLQLRRRSILVGLYTLAI